MTTTGMEARTTFARSPQLARRQRLSNIARWVFLATTVSSLFVLLFLGIDLARSGAGRIGWDFFTSFPSRNASAAGLRSSLIGSAWLLAMTVLFTVPISVGTAVWIEEFAPRNRFMDFVKLNLANLAGVPSIIFGVLGLVVFARLFGLGPSLLTGALTLFLMIMPMTVIASQEAIRQVPPSLREGSLALGLTEWQTTWYQVLPTAAPGILTGVILGVSRAAGETAALIMIGAFAFIAFDNTSPFDSFTTLPIQIYNWTVRPQPAFQEIAASGIIVLMVLVLAFNLTAAVIRERFRR